MKKNLLSKVALAIVFIMLSLGSVWAIFDDLPLLGPFPLSYLNIQNKHIGDFIPQDSTIVISADLLKADIPTLEKLATSLPTFSLLQQILSVFLQQRSTVLNPQHDILPWLDRTLALVVMDMETVVPETTLIAETRNIPRTRRFIEKLLTYTGQKYTEKQYENYKIFQIKIEPSQNLPTFSNSSPAGKKSLELSSIQINTALVENFLVISIGENSNAITKIINTVTKQVPALAEESYQLNSQAVLGVYYRPPNEKSEDTLIDHLTGNLVSTKNQLVFEYTIEGHKPHLQNNNVTVSGNNSTFTPSLLNSIPQQPCIGAYLLPRISSLLVDAKQPFPLPFSQNSNQFQINLQQNLHLALDDWLGIANEETAFLVAQDAFGYMAKFSNLSQTFKALEKFEKVWNQGVDFDHFLKPQHKGAPRSIAYQFVDEKIEKYQLTTSADEYAINLTTWADSNASTPLITKKVASENNELVWTPSWSVVDNVFVFTSSKKALEEFINNKAQNPLSAKTQVQALLKEQQPLLGFITLASKTFKATPLGSAINLDVGINLGLVNVNQIFQEIINASSDTTAAFWGTSYTTGGKVMLTLE